MWLYTLVSAQVLAEASFSESYLLHLHCVFVPNLVMWVTFFLKCTAHACTAFFSVAFFHLDLPLHHLLFSVSPSEFYLPQQVFCVCLILIICVSKWQPGPPFLWWCFILSFVHFATFVSLGTLSFRASPSGISFCILVKSQIAFQRVGWSASLGRAHPLVRLLCLVGFGGSKGQVGVRMAVTRFPPMSVLEHLLRGRLAKGFLLKRPEDPTVDSCPVLPPHSSIPHRSKVAR